MNETYIDHNDDEARSEVDALEARVSAQGEEETAIFFRERLRLVAEIKQMEADPGRYRPELRAKIRELAALRAIDALEHLALAMSSGADFSDRAPIDDAAFDDDEDDVADG